MNPSRRELLKASLALPAAMIPFPAIALTTKPPVNTVEIVELPKRLEHLSIDTWPATALNEIIGGLRADLFDFDCWHPRLNMFAISSRVLKSRSNPVVQGEHVAFEGDVFSYAWFDHYCSTFQIENIADFKELLDCYLTPALATYVRSVNMLSPNAEQIITAPSAETACGPRTPFVTQHRLGLTVTSHAELRDCGRWFAVFDMMTAFRWRLHEDNVRTVDERLAEIGAYSVYKGEIL